MVSIGRCHSGDRPLKDEQHPASSEGSGFKAEVASLIALVDRFKSCMQPASQQQSLPKHFKEASRAVGHIKPRLQAKCFRVAFVGEAKGEVLHQNNFVHLKS